MQGFWLVFSIIVTVYISYKCLSDGFSKWASYYFIPAMALAIWAVRRWMMKRMEKHQEFLRQQQENSK